jgi:predicted negative regulator of RcsB-dependent stress response
MVLPVRPSRFSEVELKQYKKEQMAKTGLLDTLDIAERQPVFLKDKGDALYAQGNFMGAINAYSTAIQLDPEP